MMVKQIFVLSSNSCSNSSESGSGTGTDSTVGRTGGSMVTARLVLAHALKKLLTKRSLWRCKPLS